MRLYLRDELMKSESKDAGGKGPAISHTGEQRGGSYAARTHIGYEKDGSPKYRYFKTAQEYQTFLTENKKNAKDLKEKVGGEHKESTDKHNETPKTEKSLRLFLRG